MNTPNTASTPGRRTLQIVGDSRYGGAGYLLLRWCAYLASRGWDVDVLATDPVVVAELEKGDIHRTEWPFIAPRKKEIL